MVRKAIKNKTVVDLLVPIQDLANKESDCFGKMWSVEANACNLCADMTVCGILYKDIVDKKAEKAEKDLGTKFLDSADFKTMVEKLPDNVVSGKTTTKELINIGMRLSNCDDELSVKNKLKEWIISTEGVRTKGGILWVD